MQDIVTFDRYEIKLSGAGGQGIILAGIILAHSIAIYEDQFVAMSQSYGPEARGGSCSAEIIINDSVIDYPRAEGYDLLLAMNQESYDKYHKNIKDSGLIIIDSSFVHNTPHINIVSLPFSKIARKKLNKEITATIIALGSLCKLTGIININKLQRGLSDKVPEISKKINLKALKTGYTMAQEFIEKNPNNPNIKETDDEDPFD